MHDKTKCRFCQLANGAISSFVVYEDECVTCFLSLEPISEGHTLIVPKKAYLDIDELDSKTATHVMKTAALISTAMKALYNPDGISIMLNGGAINDVGHFHMHVFPRVKGDGFGWTFGRYNQSEFYTKEVQEKLREGIISAQKK
jgi:diadenosine tetraphosphate (Ap4A) HIT family hydrolase